MNECNAISLHDRGFSLSVKRNLPSDSTRRVRDNPLMRDITKEYILELIEDGVKRHGSQATYEKVIGLNEQALKDIRRAKKCPPADIWQKIAREAGLEEDRYILRNQQKEDGVLSAIKAIISALCSKGNPADHLETVLTHEMRMLRTNHRPDAAETIRLLLEFLNSGLPQIKPQEAHTPSPRGLDQSRTRKSRRN